MTTDTTTDVHEIVRLHRDTDAREVAVAAYDQLLGLLEELDEPDWDAPTVCTDWTVADMVGHLIGAARSYASIPETIRQQVHGVRHRAEFDGNALDACNALQVRDHAYLSPTERIAELRRWAPRAVAGRMGFPGLLRRINVPLDQGGSTAPGLPPKLNLGHLQDAILTRDVWLHRIDIARATGRDPELDQHADRRIVADVVAEWAGRHGKPFTLELSGPAGGRFRQGRGGPDLTYDTADFAWILSGRAAAEGLLTSRVLF